jgi:RNA polymerase sigma factor (sigma-70 family)
MVMDNPTRFRYLFEQAYPALLRYALHRGLTGPDAGDLVAATLEIAWRRLEDVPVQEPLPWLYGVARNLLHNQRRQSRRRDAVLSRLADMHGRLTSAEPGEPGELDPGALRRALAGLSEGDQELLKLVAWDGLSPAQAAEVVGCSAAAARTRLHRARSRLARRLGLDPRDQGARGKGSREAVSRQEASRPTGAARTISSGGVKVARADPQEASGG